MTCRSGACAIGGAGARGNAIGNITITGTADITARAPSGRASPIGASYWGSCGDILINGNAKVTSTSGQHSAAIGGASLTTVGNITINGNATVNAINASTIDDSTAIGSGLGSMVQSLGDIVIGGNAKVTATSELGLAIGNIEWHRENQQYGTDTAGDYPVINENTITIGENATFTGQSGDIYTTTTINGKEFKAAEISYTSTDGLLYSDGSELDKTDLQETLLNITKGGTYTIVEGSVGKILINTTDAVTLQGGDYDLSEIQIIGQSKNIDLTINNLRITNKAVSASVIKFGSGAGNKLTVKGTNDFSVVKGSTAGINIGGGNIGGNGSLKVTTLNGAAIGTDGPEDLITSNIVIDSGTFDLEAQSGACGIGGAGNGSKIGNITITGTAHVKAKTPQGYAAAIGSSYRGKVGDITINGDATVEATSGIQTAAIGSAVYCENGNITIGERASVIANTTSTDVKDAAIGGTYGDQVKSLGDINIIEDATVIASSGHGLALDNRLYVESKTYADNYWVDNDNTIFISGDTSTANQSTVILTNGNTSDTVNIGGRTYQGGKMIFYDGNIWTTIDGGFVYHGLASNDPSKTADVTLIGSELKDSNGDGTPDNIKVEAFNYSSMIGVMGFMSGFSGEVTLNGKDVGVVGDDDYEIHFTAKLIDNPTEAAKRYAATKEVRGISNGATVNANENDIVGFDDNAKVHMGDVERFTFYNKNHKNDDSPHTYIGIKNNNAGADLTVANGLLSEIGGLNDGYSVSITSSNNISNELKFNDVERGNLEFTSNVDNIVEVNFGGTNSAQSITGIGKALKIIGSSGDDLLRAGATNITLTSGAGNDTFRFSEGLTNCVIVDYTEGEDVIYHELPFADLSINGSIIGSDYVFAASEKTITVKDDADKVIEVVDVNGASRFFGKYLNLDDNDSATVTAQSGVATIDAGLRTEDIVINGNSGDNTIISSSGNCTLSGGDGSDLFVYSAGDDVINDYASGDKISLGTAISSSYISGATAVFKTESGTLKIQNAKDKILNLIDSSGEEYSIKVRNTAQIINDFTGKNIDVLNKIFVTTAEELDTLKTVEMSVLEISNSQEVNLSAFDNPQIVSLEGGNQNVQFNDENGNVAVVDNNAAGFKTIIFGNGNDLGIFCSPNANISVTVGSGRDSIISDDNASVRVDMTDSDEAKIIPYSGRIILDNYNPNSRTQIVLPEGTNITSAIKDNSIQLTGNEVRLNSSTSIELNNAADSNIVNLSTESDTQKISFTGINGGVVDTHEMRGNFLLKGNYAENSSDKQKSKPSTLISGNGYDTILAGTTDLVDAGNGENEIFLTPYDLRQIKDGATIVSGGNGRNTVHGFHEGFGYDADVIQVDDFNNLKFQFDTDGLLLTANDSRIKFDGIGITSAATDDSTNSLGTDSAELIQITNGFSTMKTAVAKTNQSILIQEDDDIPPNTFFGNRSGLNFSEYSDSVEINLADGTGKIGKWDATFKGINKLQAGNGMSTLIGDDNNNTLIAGNGYTSIWGGAGNDALIGRGNSVDKEGRTTFFFFAGDGRDVISDFTFLTPDNRYDGIDDRINVGDSDINDAYRVGNNVVVVFDQNSYLILENAAGKDFQIADMIAKVDKNIAYNGLADCYVASGGSSLTADSSVDSVEIWLDNSHGTQFLGNIRTLEASAVEGTTSLVGNEFDDTIIAGQGDASLWGGFSTSNDLLIGGNSCNTFFYCMGNGNDTIQVANDCDFVILSDILLDQIISTNITTDAVAINFKDGGSLEINGSSDVTYQLANDSNFSANHENFNWNFK